MFEQRREKKVNQRLLCVSLALFLSASGCSGEAPTQPPEVDTAMYLEEATADAAPYGASTISVERITFSPADGVQQMNVRSAPGTSQENLCGKVGSFSVDNATVIVSAGPTNFAGDWISVPANAVPYDTFSKSCENTAAVWVNGANVDELTAPTAAGTSHYSADDNGRFVLGEIAPNEMLETGGDWQYLTALAAGLVQQQG